MTSKGEAALLGHYANLAGTYNLLWEHTPGFRDWMCRTVLELADLPLAPVVADVGGGTGIYAVGLMEELGDKAEIVVVDPSSEMLAKVPQRPGLSTVHSSAEEAPAALRSGGVPPLDLILVKEAVHHFSDRRSTLEGLAGLLGMGGVIVVVMLPKSIEYPLFDEALARFELTQPDPDVIGQYLAALGLETEMEIRGFDLDPPVEQWIDMVSALCRFMRSTFDDDQLAWESQR